MHTQTLAAMNPLADSYEELFDVACRIGIIPAELSQLFLLMTMNVISGNIDDHNKNFSFMMASDGVWHITPAYDFTFSVDTSAPGYINRHCLTINNKNADNCDVSNVQANKEYYLQAVEQLKQYAQEATSDDEREYYESYAAYYENAAASMDKTITALGDLTDEMKAKYAEVGGTSFLDGGYTVFGQMVDGFDVLDSVSAVEVQENSSGELSSPVETVTIESVKIYIKA